MGLLANIMASDAATITDTDGFGEAITYKPANGSPLPINAQVFRSQPVAIQGIADFQNVTMIEVANSSLTGILSSSLTLGADKVNLPEKVGQPPSDFIIRQIVTHDAGMLRLIVS